LRGIVHGAKATLKFGLASIAVSTVISCARRSRYFNRKVLPRLIEATNFLVEPVFRIGDAVLDRVGEIISRFRKNDRKKYGSTYERYDPYEGFRDPQPSRENPSRTRQTHYSQPLRERGYDPRKDQRYDPYESTARNSVYQDLWSDVQQRYKRVKEKVKQKSNLALDYVYRYFSNEAFWERLNEEHDCVKALRLIYETYPPKNPTHRLPPTAYTRAAYRPSTQKSLVKRALVHYHPDKNPKRQYGRKWSKICKRATEVLLHHFKYLQSETLS